ncbi:hypothetical protein Tco_0414895 [Tanacetum coccineum]
MQRHNVFKFPRRTSFKEDVYDIGLFIKMVLQTNRKKEARGKAELEGPAFNLLKLSQEQRSSNSANIYNRLPLGGPLCQYNKGMLTKKCGSEDDKSEEQNFINSGSRKDYRSGGSSKSGKLCWQKEIRDIRLPG